jgi:hypothetical protein
VDLGNLNRIYKRELNKLDVHRGKGRWKLDVHRGKGRWNVSKDGEGRKGCRIGNRRGAR